MSGKMACPVPHSWEVRESSVNPGLLEFTAHALLPLSSAATWPQASTSLTLIGTEPRERKKSANVKGTRQPFKSCRRYTLPALMMELT